MYEELVQNLRAIDEYESGYAKLMWDAADVVERKTGKWILPNNAVAVSLNEWICSECNYLINGKHRYCPNCGADMRGDDDV